MALVYLKRMDSPERLEGARAMPWIRGQMGDAAADIIWEPLLRGKFGSAAETIGLPWFWARVHDRTSKLGYLGGGFQRLYEALAEAAITAGSEVHLGRQVSRIESSRDTIVVAHAATGAADATEEQFDLVVSTLPTRLTAELTPAMPRSWRDQHDPGPALGAHCLILALDRPLTDAYWINVNDPGFPFLALVEHTNMRSPAEYGGQHLVYLGSYRKMDDPVLTTDPQTLLDQWLPDLQRINPDLDRSWITRVWGFSAPFAQPIVTVDYPKRIPPFHTPGVGAVGGEHVPGLPPRPGPELLHRARRAPGQGHGLMRGSRGLVTAAALVFVACSAPASPSVSPFPTLANPPFGTPVPRGSQSRSSRPGTSRAATRPETKPRPICSIGWSSRPESCWRWVTLPTPMAPPRTSRIATTRPGVAGESRRSPHPATTNTTSAGPHPTSHTSGPSLAPQRGLHRLGPRILGHPGASTRTAARPAAATARRPRPFHRRDHRRGSPGQPAQVRARDVAPPALELRGRARVRRPNAGPMADAGHGRSGHRPVRPRPRLRALRADGWRRRTHAGRSVQFVVGTGGRSHHQFGDILPTSAVHDNSTFGVLHLTLRTGGYDWEFVPTTPAGSRTRARPVADRNQCDTASRRRPPHGAMECPPARIQCPRSGSAGSDADVRYEGDPGDMAMPMAVRPRAGISEQVVNGDNRRAPGGPPVDALEHLSSRARHCRLDRYHQSQRIEHRLNRVKPQPQHRQGGQDGGRRRRTRKPSPTSARGPAGLSSAIGQILVAMATPKSRPAARPVPSHVGDREAHYQGEDQAVHVSEQDGRLEPT